MSVYTMEYRCEKEQTVLEIRKKVYEDVLTQALEEESAGDFYQGDRQEYGLTPEECAREAANFHVDNMIYDSIEAGLNVPRKQDKFAFRYFSKIDTKEARHIVDFCYKCGYFVKRLAKLTILCYYFNPKTQRLKYQ